ncbi:MAG: Ca-activated chloride channel family protein [Pseudohongiellaceae bacterium]|jgi:Ca-activated chloride channel family protein
MFYSAYNKGKIMNIYLKVLVPIAIAATVGCASNQESMTDAVIKGEARNTNLSIVHLEKETKGDVVASELAESVALSATTTNNALQVVHVKVRGKQAAQKAGSYLYMPSQVRSTQIHPADAPIHYYQDEGREKYASVEQSNVKQVLSEPVSTFSIDVDTGSYTNIRRMLNQGNMPPVDAVRIEEMINYFDYAYDVPESLNQPFSIKTEIAQSPWSSDHILLQVGLKGFELIEENRPAANLVFLLDVSGSMNSPKKLPLLKKSLIMMSKQLTADDKVSIVVYAGASGVVLEPTAGNQTLEIEQALEKLMAGGSTNGHSGIQLAYKLAKKAYDPKGINRVILATDGDFNVGSSDVESLKKLIAQQHKEGIALTTLGFGTGNYNDELMEQLADVGNGNYAYIDGLNEARKVLVEELSSTLLTIAQDVKIQIEFNSSIVKEYRLLGYENRALKREDFNNDKVDAGDVGAGHSVTALYELVLQSNDSSRIDPLRYHQEARKAKQTLNLNASELGFIKFRYKDLNSIKSKLISRPIPTPSDISTFENASSDFRFSTTVAEFGEVLRQSKYLETVDYNTMIKHALDSKGADPFGYRSEFIQLLRLASKL